MTRQFDIREPSIEALRAAPVYFRWGANSRRTLVDGLTANAILACYDAMKPENQTKVARMIATPAGLARMAGFAWKHVKI